MLKGKKEEKEREENKNDESQVWRNRLVINLSYFETESYGWFFLLVQLQFGNPLPISFLPQIILPTGLVIKLLIFSCDF